MKIGNKDMRQALTPFLENDWEVDRTKKNHLKLTHKSGRVFFAPSTPSDARSVKNTVAGLERIEREAESNTEETPTEKDDNVVKIKKSEKKREVYEANRSTSILQFLRAHPNRAYSVAEIATALWPEEYENDERATGSRVSTAAARAMKLDECVERPQRGVYKYVPDYSNSDDTTEDRIETGENTLSETPVRTPDVDSGQEVGALLEAVRILSDGRILCEGENGNLYVATRIEI